MKTPGVAVVLFAAPVAALAQPSFQGLPFLGSGSYARVHDVSGDGTTVVGEAPPNSSSERNAVSWRNGAIRDHGRISGRDAAAWGADFSGDAIVGTTDISGGAQEVAARFTPTGIVPLTDYWTGRLATAVSGDGSTIVGGGGEPGGFIIDAAGYRPLGRLGPSGSSYGFGASHDGRVVAGTWNSGNTATGYRAFRWENEAMVELPALYGEAQARDVSADGRVIVGTSGRRYLRNAAVAWTDGVPQDLGTLADERGDGVVGWAEAMAASADGSVIVGWSGILSNTGGWTGPLTAFIWTQSGGMRPLSDWLLAEHGVSAEGWTFQEAMGISDDGLTIVGNGIDPGGLGRPFVIRVPAPAGGLIFALLPVLRTRRRRGPSRTT